MDSLFPFGCLLDKRDPFSCKAVLCSGEFSLFCVDLQLLLLLSTHNRAESRQGCIFFLFAKGRGKSFRKRGSNGSAVFLSGNPGALWNTLFLLKSPLLFSLVFRKGEGIWHREAESKDPEVREKQKNPRSKSLCGAYQCLVPKVRVRILPIFSRLANSRGPR